LAGADLVMSIHPGYQETFVTRDLPREERIDLPVPDGVIERLQGLPEFVRAYEPDGMRPAEFMAFGLTQRTLGQFCESGWKPMETFL
jgi:transaldolase